MNTNAATLLASARTAKKNRDLRAMNEIAELAARIGAFGNGTSTDTIRAAWIACNPGATARDFGLAIDLLRFDAAGQRAEYLARIATVAA